MINLIRTDSDNGDFRALVAELDKDLAVRDGAEHGFYAQFNKIDAIRHVVVAYLTDGTPVGCGAFKPYSDAVYPNATADQTDVRTARTPRTRRRRYRPGRTRTLGR